MPIRIGKAGKATALNELGRRRNDEGDQDGALEAYAQASAIHPGWSVPWYNAGLIHKYRGEWAASLQANARAVQCEPGNEGALWNLGIAATAVGDWTTARRAWRQYGIAIPEGEGPVDYFVGLTPIRVHGDEGTEVVWADRIDPARAILRNVPTPACGHRYGDLVLHDGAPNGYRLRGEREVAVFDALEVIAPSAHSTYEVSVEGAAAEDIEALVQRFKAADGFAENWTDSMEMLCRACSEGRPFGEGRHNHGADEAPGTLGPWRLGIASREEAGARRILDEWKAATSPEVVLHDFRCVLPATPRS
ncbi:tetratricopeptide (TPR) repeat protein [Variovorax boronicumulans]|uniref:Tetratricopeptide (TPR) repeat protein n=1 Tax=Variovorax boronicumulans TaxID=436515 RepID=A0AAW8CMP2_9BURK|nr:tetratricopeptide repeat protein [Variovorax boronicumulans]MDP9891625.1 tetratricopeptide (TPR) repeat protein [Variovorax boronicumulans]MDQ0052798.1 tetratricopeptide (TPR) repeat protein [Variovorax boronicumulans]